MADAKDAGSRGNDPGKGGNFTNPIWGTDSDGKEVTVAFGRDNTTERGGVIISEGLKSDKDFNGTKDDRGHDHFNGQAGGTDRGQYPARS